MNLEIWLLFVVTEAALCLSPGPAVLYVSSQALSHGFRASLAANFGIVAGNVIYFSASALGLGAMILASHDFFLLIKWCGVAYLMYLGLRMILGASSLASIEPAAAMKKRAIFRGGLVVQLANPKNLIFFVAILPPFIDPSANLPMQILILGVTSQFIEIVVLSGYGLLASGAGRWLRRSRMAVWADRLAGSAVIAVGAGLALLRRAET